jgi:hypothetical protein
MGQTLNLNRSIHSMKLADMSEQALQAALKKLKQAGISFLA